MRGSVSEALEQAGYRTTCCASAVEALHVLEVEDADVVLTDLRMPVLDGLGLCERIMRNAEIPVVVMTAFGEVTSAIAAMRAGAFDFIAKPFDLTELETVVERAARHSAERPTTVRRLDQAPHSFRARGVVGSSPKMRDLLQYVAFIAHSDASVLITGESGTGKELIARALHENGDGMPVRRAARRSRRRSSRASFSGT
jgi:DNA-binding NtrC family response regulator